MRVRNSIFESVAMLALLGILAGAVGGLGIGLISSKSSTTTTAATH